MARSSAVVGSSREGAGCAATGGSLAGISAIITVSSTKVAPARHRSVPALHRLARRWPAVIGRRGFGEALNRLGQALGHLGRRLGRRKGRAEIELRPWLLVDLGLEHDLLQDGDRLVGHHHVLGRRAARFGQIEDVIEIVIDRRRLGGASDTAQRPLDVGNHLRIGCLIVGILDPDLLRIL